MHSLKIGDVVLVRESGYGFREADVGKHVEIVCVWADDTYTIREYDQELMATPYGKKAKSFGENPMVLLNTIEERERMEKEIKVGDWVEVVTNHYEYMGLMVGDVVQVKSVWERDQWEDVVEFTKNGKAWMLSVDQVRRCSDRAQEQLHVLSSDNVLKVQRTTAPIKSDGGSSSYYDIQLPQWLLDKLNERAQNGQCYIKTEELIEAAFSSDFDAGNLQKSLVRAWGAFNGGGKLGNDVKYEMTKVKYSADKIIERFERKEGNK